MFKWLNNIFVKGWVEATKFITRDGTSSQFVKGDGTLDGNTYALDSDLDGLASETYVDTEIDNIEIGGRNLAQLTNSKEWVRYGGGTLSFGEYKGLTTIKSTDDGSEYLGFQQGPNARKMLLRAGEQYIISLLVRGTVRLAYSYIMNTGSANISFGNFTYEQPLNSETFVKAYVKITATNAHELSTGSWFMTRPTVINDGDWVEITQLKIEKGNKATDWTPAPEDQISDWLQNEPTAFDFIKNKPTKLSDFINDGFATESWVNNQGYLTEETDPIFTSSPAHGISNTDITNWNEKGVQLTADQPNANIHLKDSAGNIISTLNVGFLNNEGTTISFNTTTDEIELKNDEGVLLSSFPASALMTGVGFGLNLTGTSLELLDSANNVIDSVTLTITNIQGLQTALDGKAPTSRTITAGTGLTGGGTLAANRTFNVDFTEVATAAQGDLADTALQPSDLNGYATEAYVDNNVFSGDYNDLSNAPTIPTNNNQLTNGAGYITSSALNGYATETWTNLNFDNYQSWNLKTNGVQRTTIQSDGTLDLVAGTNIGLSYGAGGKVTINSISGDIILREGLGAKSIYREGMVPGTAAAGICSIVIADSSSVSGDYSGVLLGFQNNIEEYCEKSGIFAGDTNTIANGGATNAIIGGNNNEISKTADSAIIGGEGNYIGGGRSVILGGTGITATEDDMVYAPNYKVTEDNNTDNAEYVAMVVQSQYGASDPTASNYPEGTILIKYD